MDAACFRSSTLGVPLHCHWIGSDRVELPAEQKLHTHDSDKLKENRHDKGSSLADMVVSCGKFKT